VPHTRPKVEFLLETIVQRLAPASVLKIGRGHLAKQAQGRPTLTSPETGPWAETYARASRCDHFRLAEPPPMALRPPCLSNSWNKPVQRPGSAWLGKRQECRREISNNLGLGSMATKVLRTIYFSSFQNLSRGASMGWSEGRAPHLMHDTRNSYQWASRANGCINAVGIIVDVSFLRLGLLSRVPMQVRRPTCRTNRTL